MAKNLKETIKIQNKEAAMTTSEETTPTCFICGKELPGDAGLECASCHTKFCLFAHRKEMGFKLSAGYSESPCPKCGQPLIADTSEEDAAGGDIPSEKKPEGFYITSQKVPEACPNCGGSNIRAVDRPVKSTGGRLFDIVMGLVFLGGVWYLNNTGQLSDMNETLSLVILVVGLFGGLGFLWTGLTLRPVPMLGRYIIAPGFETHATCVDCQHAWVAPR
jgi:hypothetical protein